MVVCKGLSFIKPRGSNMTNSWLCSEGKEEQERLVEKRINRVYKIIQNKTDKNVRVKSRFVYIEDQVGLDRVKWTWG